MRNLLLIAVVCFWGFPGRSQANFDPSQPGWMENYGTPMALIYGDLKTALKSKAPVYKLHSKNDTWDAKSYAKLNKLSDLELAHLVNNGLTELSAQWGDLSHLQILVSQNNLIQYIDTLFCNASRLQMLELRGANLDSIPRQFEQMRYLTFLRIFENGADTLKFSDSLDFIPNLEVFDLFRAPVYTFPHFLWKCSYLQYIRIESGKLSEIPDSLSLVTNLRSLDLERNSISTIPKSLLQCKNLEILNLRNNKITHVPDWIARLPNLRYLDLRGNNIPKEEKDLIKTLFSYQADVLFD